MTKTRAKTIYTQGKVQLTTNYGLFELMDSFQRAIKTPQVNNLVRSMRQENLLPFNPIIVFPNPKKKGKFLILDGQHRCEAAKALGLPIHYIVNTRIKTMKEAMNSILLLNNNSKPFSAAQTLQTRLDGGDDILKEMDFILKDCGLTEIPFALGVALLYQMQTGGSLNRALTAGNLRVKNEEGVRELAGILKTIDFDRKYRQPFVMFIVRIMKNGGDKKEVKKLLRQVRNIDWVPQRNELAYRHMFEAETGTFI